MHLEHIVIRIIDTFENGGLIEEFTQKGAPKLIYNGSDDKYQEVMTAEFSFNMLVTDLTDGKFYHLYTGNEKRYKVTVHSQNDELLLFEGFLLPDFYSEPYKNGSVFVQLTATDGIGLLKGHYLADEFYKKETSVMKLICECLKLCRLDKTIHFTPSFISAATDYLFHEIVVDGHSYLDGEINPKPTWTEVMPARKSAYDILALLLKNIGCTLYAWSDVWYLEGINRKHQQQQLYQKYNLDCEFLGEYYEYKSIQKVTFFKTPTVSIVSPWQNVQVTIDLDEDGDLLSPGPYVEADVDPSFLDEAIPVLGVDYSNKAPLNLWQSNGIATKFLRPKRNEYMFPPDFDLWFGQSVVPTGIPPLVIGVQVRTGTASETPAGNPVNYLSIKTPKYIRKSDNRLARFLTFSIALYSPLGGTLGFGTSDDAYYKDGLEDGIFKWMYRAAVYVGDELIRSSQTSVPKSKRLVWDLNYSGRQWSEEIDDYTEEISGYVSSPSKITGRAEFDELYNQKSGFAQIHLMGVTPPDVNDQWLWQYAVTDLKLEYTEEKTWEDDIQRAIDYTTKYELELFHGDTVSDLTQKNFRFRRFVTPPDIAVDVDFGVRYEFTGLFVTYFRFAISYHDSVAIENSLSDLIMIINGLPVTLSELYPTATGFEYLVQIVEDSGVFFLSFLKAETSYFDDINAWGSVQVVPIGAEYGWVTEDNEWREQWKRFGVEENVRYGRALADIYHSVQPEPLVRIEGQLRKIYNPRELLKFNWRGDKVFIPTRLSMNFSEGITDVLMLESLYENVPTFGKYFDGIIT